MSRSLPLAAMMLALALPALAQTGAERASLDCAKAKLPAERMICASQDLMALNREMKAAFETALVTVGHSGKSALRRDQASFIAIRDAAATRSTAELSTALTMRRDFLRAIRETKGQWFGAYANAFGSIEIEQGHAGIIRVRLHAADALNGRWICEFDDSAVLTRTTLIAGAESATEIAGGPNEGWTIAFRLAGDILLSEPLRPRGSDRPMPFCGVGGNVAGNFFAIDPSLAPHVAVITPELEQDVAISGDRPKDRP